MKNQATSRTKVTEALNKTETNTNFHKRDSNFSATKIGFVNIHPFWGHFGVYFIELYFDSYGLKPSNLFSDFINERIGKCIFSEKKDTKNSQLMCCVLLIYYLLN